MVARATKGSADLTRKEIKEGWYIARWRFSPISGGMKSQLEMIIPITPR
jgi:hypothetical protein